MPREPITRAWIAQHAGTVLALHLNMGDKHVLTKNVVDKRDRRPIGLSYTDTRWKRTKRNAERGGTSQRSWSVDTHPGLIATLDEALEIVAIIRAADDQVTEAA